MTAQTKQEELEQKLYDLAVCNVTDDLGGDFYALDPKKVHELINSEVLSAVDGMLNMLEAETSMADHDNDVSIWKLRRNMQAHGESIKNRYKI